MSEQKGRPAPHFSGWEPVIDAALELAGSYPEPYRLPIFEALLNSASEPAQPQRAAPSVPTSEGENDGGGGDPITEAARAAGVDPAKLATYVHVEEDGEFRLLFPSLGGGSKAEKANRTAAAYVFIKQHGFGEIDVDIEEIRDEVDRQKAYDPPNFTRNFRSYPWLLEIGKTGSPKKKYRLSPEGQEAAREILREALNET